MPIISCTYNEFKLVKIFVKKWQSVAPTEVIIISNSHPGDDTSKYLKQKNVIEIPCTENDFWGAAIQKALIYCENHMETNQNLIITNIDVLPEKNSVFDDYFFEMLPMEALSYTTRSKNKLYYSGVKKSKFLPLIKKNIIPKINEIKSIDYCPTRFLCIKNTLKVKLSELIPCSTLPHYGCDFIFTYRLIKNGFRLNCTSRKHLNYNPDNSGAKNNITKYSLTYLLTNIKSAHNVKYKFKALRLLDFNFVLVILYLFLFYTFFILRCLLLYGKNIAASNSRY